MPLTPITDYEDREIARLAQQFKDKPGIEGWVQTFAAQTQYLEDMINQIAQFTNVFTAIGAQLDLMGNIVGEPRRGRNDIDYRIGVLGKIAINTSKGTPENAISIFSLLTGATIVSLLEYFPAVVDISGNAPFQYSYEYLGPDSFAFDGGPDGLGFGDVFDPSVGGLFAGLIINDVTYLYHLMDSILAAGVRLEHLGYFDDTPFCFDGDPHGFGFGDYFDSTVGGDFATIII